MTKPLASRGGGKVTLRHDADRCGHVDAFTGRRCRRAAAAPAEYNASRYGDAGAVTGWVRMYLCVPHGGEEKPKRKGRRA